MKRYFFIGLLSLVFFASCTVDSPSSTATIKTAESESDPFKDCKAGKPQAIFKGDYPQVVKQDFQIKNREGIEMVRFENGLALELIQQGCDKVTQVFQFVIPQKFGDDQDWMLLAADQFSYLSRTSEKHGMLGMWGQTIRSSAPNLQLGEQQTLQPGISIKVNKVQSASFTTLLVELGQE